MTDYEKAMRNALRELFPNSQLYGCWFHYCQALKKHVHAIPGLAAKIRNEKRLHKLYYKFMCLALLPGENIVEAFNMLKLEANAAHPGTFDKFFRYYEKQWIRMV